MPDEVLAKQYLTEGMKLVKKGDNHAAIRIFMRLTTEIPDSDLADNAFYNMGICHKMAGEPEKAHVAFSAVVKNYPDSDAAFFAKDQLEDLKDALDPASPHYLEAEEALMNKNYDGANDGFAKILREFPDSRLVDNALFGLGMIAKKQGDTSRANKIFKRILEKYPDSDAAESVRMMGIKL
jgi:TolA-binding protein